MLRAILTLLAGGALAQALPLLLGPWITRLYDPATYGHFQLWAVVAANLAVVACARYEFALPMAQGDAEVAALRALCLRLLAGSTGLSALGALAWAWATGALWPLWLPVGVALLGGLSLATLLATRAQQFRGLAVSRVLQHGGGAVLQVAAGLLQAGVHGLILAPLLAAVAAVAPLRAGAGWAGAGWPAPTAASGARLGDGAVGAGQGTAAAATTADTSAATTAATSTATATLAPDWRGAARRFKAFPLLNTPHAFLGALQDTLAVGLITAQLGPAAAGAWGLALRYLKAPATLVGGAVSQALYPRLAQAGCTVAGRRLVLQAMALLALLAAPLVLLLWWAGPSAFAWAFGPPWREAGELARALGLYIGLHFVASPLGVVTLAWEAQAWALKLALVGQGMFVLALGGGLAWGGLRGAGWAVSAAMAAYFGWYFFKLATWPVRAADARAAVAPPGAAA